MAASSAIQRSLLILVVLVGIYAFGERHGVEAEVTVANNLQGEPLIVLNPPGCCSPCEPNPRDPNAGCPQICVHCRSMIIDAGQEAMLDQRVGPFPEDTLKIQLKEGIYCLHDQHMSGSATVSVGPGHCDCDFEEAGLQATVHGAPLCLPPCDA